MKDRNINDLKIILANKTTAMLHGKKAAQNSEEAAKEAFSGKSLGENLPKINIKTKKINIIDLVLLSKLESSKSEIRRLIKGKGIRINNEIINDEKFSIQKKSFGKNNFLKLSIGKKKHIKIKLA